MSFCGNHVLTNKFGTLPFDGSFSNFQRKLYSGNFLVTLMIICCFLSSNRSPLALVPKDIKTDPFLESRIKFSKSDGIGLGSEICNPPTSITLRGRGTGKSTAGWTFKNVRTPFCDKSKALGRLLVLYNDETSLSNLGWKMYFRYLKKDHFINFFINLDEQAWKWSDYF